MVQSQKKCITKYEKINKQLNKVALLYINSMREDELKEFISKQRKENRKAKGMSNSLIEIPEDNIKDVLKHEYTNNSTTKGEIGTIPIEDQVYQIKNITLLMLMSNRLAKLYGKKLENACLDEQKRQTYEKNQNELLTLKHNITSDLIASLYIIRKTGDKEYTDLFLYGENRKEGEQDSFVIDLPYVGQISVHYGYHKKHIIEEARDKVISILERKMELGQIEKEEFGKLKRELEEGKVLPMYRGNIYEYVSGLPIEYIGKNTKEKIKQLGLDKKLPEEITHKDINKMIEGGLNEREAYYLAVKLGFPKLQLQKVINLYSQIEMPKETKLGRKAIIMTTPEEREKMLIYEQRNRQEHTRGNDN